MGQTCVCANRLLVQDDIYDNFAARLTQAVSGHTFLLHDGRARNVKEAILWHDGEARRSRETFSRLDKRDRDRLIAFVNAL